METEIIMDRTAPKYDGTYLCIIEEPQPCGNVWRYWKTIERVTAVFQIKEGQRVIAWKWLRPVPSYPTPITKCRMCEIGLPLDRDGVHEDAFGDKATCEAFDRTTRIRDSDSSGAEGGPAGTEPANSAGRSESEGIAQITK
jgi:hypothetical protein